LRGNALVRVTYLVRADARDSVEELAGCDVVFYTAAYFREYYGAGRPLAKTRGHQRAVAA
jgi:hypothetical protein